MKNLLKAAIATMALTLGSALPMMAEIDNGLDFTTASPFYAGNTLMPAGSYKISQPDINSEELLIQSANGKDAAFVGFVPTHAKQPHQHTDVTFDKDGNVEYLSRIWVEGQRYGMKLEPTKAELKAAAAAAAAPAEDTNAGE
jgi:hypothetical protein